MEPDFWLERWQQTQIHFDQPNPNDLLQAHWSALGLAHGSTVFVPLCGKSVDMVWLAGQGHKIVGNELSPIAIDDFFARLNLVPETGTEPGFTIKSAGPYEFWCGDFFALPDAATVGISAIYDRAALMALPPDMRKRYAHKLTNLGTSNVRTLLITVEYDQSVLPGPPHSVTHDEVGALFADSHITEVDRVQTMSWTPKFKEHGIETVGQVVYLMAPHQAEIA